MDTSRKPSAGAILEKIKELFEHGSFVPRNHCRQRLDQREIPHSALLYAFETARVVRGPDFGNWRVTIEGDTLDDDPVRVGLAVDLRDEICSC